MTLKKISEVSPVIGAFLIFLGYFKLNIYYSHWGINIYSFLDFSEITLSFLNDSNTLFFFIILLFAQMSIGLVTINAIDHRKKKKLGVEDNKIIITENNELYVVDAPFDGVMEGLRRSYEIGYKRTIIVMTIMFAASFGAFLVFYNLLTLYLSFLIAIQLLLILVEKLIGIQDTDLQLQISSIITLVGFTFCLAQYDIKQTERNSPRVAIHTEDGNIINTNEKLLFLGKTNNYYIIFDKTIGRSIVMKNDQVNRTELDASHYQHLPKSGGSVVKSIFVHLSKFVLD